MTTPAPLETHAPAAPAVPSRVLVAVLVTVVAWASAFLVIRGVRAAFDPGALALGRLTVGALALGAAVLARRAWVAPTRREWLLLIACGVLWFGSYNVALNAAEQHVDAGTAAMLVNVGPVLIALLGGAFLGEGFPRWLLVGAGVAFAGAVIIGAATTGSGGRDAAGVVLCLVAAVTWSVGVLAQKPVLRRLPALQATWLSCTVGVLTCLPFAGRLAADAPRAGVPALAGLVYLGLVPTAIAFLTWAYALSKVPAGRLGVSTYLVPPLSVLGAWPLLGEAPPPLALAGGALALTGVALTRRRG